MHLNQKCSLIGFFFIFFFTGTVKAEKPLSNTLFCNDVLLANYKLYSMDKGLMEDQQDASNAKGKIFLKSLLLPGWGEYTAGHHNRAKIFMITETVLWSGFVAFQIYGHWKRSDMEKYAVEKAGVNGLGKDKSFYVDVSNFQNIYEYNEEKRRFRQYDRVYPVDDQHFWEWQNESHRKQFDDLRISGELAFRNATLVVGGILINHVLSAIDALWIARNDDQSDDTALRFSPKLQPTGQISFHVCYSTNW